MKDFTKLEMETLLNAGATEVRGFSELHAIPEGFTIVGNYEEPNPEYGYPEVVARVLRGYSGKDYIYYL